ATTPPSTSRRSCRAARSSSHESCWTPGRIRISGTTSTRRQSSAGLNAVPSPRSPTCCADAARRREVDLSARLARRGLPHRRQRLQAHLARADAEPLDDFLVERDPVGATVLDLFGLGQPGIEDALL